ncbi:MAG: gamma-glutamylcyclotransferase family protein [Pseudomonadota bacterium]
MIWYFAYGSNMNAARLFGDRLGPEGIERGERIAGRLDGWRLVFNKRARAPEGCGVGNIVAAPGEAVHGTLNLLPRQALDVLDRFEGVVGGHYRQETVQVARGDGGPTVEAVTYVALLTGEALRPTREYLAHLLAGSELLPADYCRRLRETPTID